VSSCFHYKISTTLKRHIITLSLVLLLPSLILQAWGQDYQRARDVLRALSAQETTLYLFPSPTSKKVIKLPKNASVYIYGKQGGFLDVRYQNIKGWGDSRAFIIQGPAPNVEVQPATPPSRSEPTATISSVSAPRNNGELPVRLNPSMSYVMKGKSFDKQLRLGLATTYLVTPRVSVGAVADAVFIKGTYFDFGPIVRHQWDLHTAVFNPAIYTGFLYYKISHGTDKDEGFGIQTAFENDIPIMQDKTFQPSISMKLGTDLMFFYFDEVRIPFWFSAGAAFKF
jgi:hypothetical protein